MGFNSAFKGLSMSGAIPPKYIGLQGMKSAEG